MSVLAKKWPSYNVNVNSTIINDVLNVDYISVCYIADLLNSGEKLIISLLPSMPPRCPMLTDIASRMNR